MKIKIHTEATSVEEMVDLLNDVATKVKEGYTSGHYPSWELTGEWEEDDDVADEEEVDDEVEFDVDDE